MKIMGRKVKFPRMWMMMRRVRLKADKKYDDVEGNMELANTYVPDFHFNTQGQIAINIRWQAHENIDRDCPEEREKLI